MYFEGVTYTANQHLLIRWRRPATLGSLYWSKPLSPFSSFVANTIGLSWLQPMGIQL